MRDQSESGADSGPESPLDAADVADDAATDAFKALGNETRLAVLAVLWEASGPFERDDALRFTDLRRRVGVRDSGRFSYHLDQLEGQYVESTDDGYVLTVAGRTVVQSVIAGAGTDEQTVDPTEIDMQCKICGGPVEVLYDDEWVMNRCRDCEGLFTDDRESGHLSKFHLDPAGVPDRSADELYAAGWVSGFQHLNSMIEGVCPSCSASVERSLDLCRDHDDEGVCENCSRHPRLVAKLRCPVCKEAAQSTIGGVAKYHPAAVAFHYERDITLQYGFNDLERINERLERSGSEWELRSTDPLVVRVTVTVDDDEMWLDLDEDLTVRDASR